MIPFAVIHLNEFCKIFFLFLFNRNIAIDMGLTKTEMFTNSQNRLARRMKALAHPARVAILQQLMQINSCVCGELVDDLGLAQATISQHLKELKEAGFIRGTVEGTSVCYCIDTRVWNQFRKELDQFFSAWTGDQSCC